MYHASTVDQLRRALERFRIAGDRIALVPTMGNLHAGHMALVERAREVADRVVVSLFVNPVQFGPGEDYAEYPRTFEDDRGRLLGAGVDLLFAPDVAGMYPDGEGAVRIRVDRVTEGLCSETRPHFFEGVATVVAKLFCAACPDVAVFGKKDYQQWVMVRRLARNLLLDINIEAVPVVREADGLALSSRNEYLSPADRRTAAGLFRGLRDAAADAGVGEDPRQLEADAWERIAAAGLDPEYIEVRGQGDLEPVVDLAGPRILLAAAHVGGARLIDNLELDFREGPPGHAV